MLKKNKNKLTLNTDRDLIIYERVELKKMTIKTLRALAKQRKINLQKKRKKSEIINIMFSFFLQLKNSDTDTKILPMNFDILLRILIITLILVCGLEVRVIYFHVV